MKTRLLILLMFLSGLGFSQTLVLSTDTSIGLTCLHCAQDTVKLTINIGDTINITNQATSSSYFNVDTNNVTASTNFTSYEFDTMYVYKINKDSKSVIIFAGSDNVDNLTVTFKVLIDTNTTGIDGVSYRKGFKVFPNPSNDVLNIQSGSVINKIDIENLVGQRIYSSLYNEKNVILDISNFASGVYFIRINNNFVRKIVKE